MRDVPAPLTVLYTGTAWNVSQNTWTKVSQFIA